MANTTNLNLVKPAGTDYALVSVINGNMDIIDSKVGAIPANESAQSQITALNNQMATLMKIGDAINFSVSADTAGDAYYDFTASSSISGYTLIGYHAYVGSYRICVYGVSGTRCYYTVKSPGSAGTTVQISVYPLYKKS